MASHVRGPFLFDADQVFNAVWFLFNAVWVSSISDLPLGSLFFHMCMSVAQSCLTLCDPTDCTDQALRSMGFSRQEHWTGLPCPSPEDLPDVEIEPRCPALQAASLPSELQGSPFLHP